MDKQEFQNHFSQLERKMSTESVRVNKYWMVRANGGYYYDTFRDENFVALTTNERYLQIVDNVTPFRYEETRCRKKILEQIPGYENNLRKKTLLASYIQRMAFFMHEGDLVLMPSSGASYISIGRIIEPDLIRDEQIVSRFSIARKVEWITEIPKHVLDPCLYRALGAHQAISDISQYREFVERNYNSVFSINGYSHYVLTLNSPTINARNFSKLILSILDVAQEVSNEYELDVNVNDVIMSTYLNSPGKIDLQGSLKTCLIIMTVAAALSGGGVSTDNFSIEANGIIPTLISGINEFKLTSAKIREEQLNFDTASESLSTKSVEQWTKELEEIKSTQPTQQMDSMLTDEELAVEEGGIAGEEQENL